MAFLPILAPVASADNEVAHEEKGFQESGYSLSQYENINLANGNLSFTVPLHTLKTAGGLTYPVVTHYNSKIWYSHQYCSHSGTTYQCTGETPAAILPAEIADGVEAFGFGWDLRPWRIVRSRTESQFRVLISPSGARHRIPNGIGTPDFVGRTLVTMDPTRYRFTVTAVDADDRATAIQMEDGAGHLYTFSHIVPLACNANLPASGDPGDLKDLNFQVETSGLYLTSIKRGPWGAGERDDGIPANRISVTYVAGADTELYSGDTWPADVRVLRHVEIERDNLLGNYSPNLVNDSYHYVRQTRVYTDEASGAGLDDVKTCYDNVSPYDPDPPDPTCTAVTTTNDVDEYLNPTQTVVTYTDPLTMSEATRTTNATATAEDDDDYFLRRRLTTTVSEGASSITTATVWTNLSAYLKRKHYAPQIQTLNPSNPLTAACTSDCVSHTFAYDIFGNVETDTVSGGYGSGFNSIAPTTETTYQYGHPVKMTLNPGPAGLLLWQRELDPGTGLARWHVDGSGIGFAYLWDQSGHLCQVRPSRLSSTGSAV